MTTDQEQKLRYKHPLVIPMDAGQYAVIPMGISEDDFECLKKTLDLWKVRMVDKTKKSPEQVEIERFFGPQAEDEKSAEGSPKL